MAIDFNVKDVLHKTVVRFVRSYLPDVEKPYALRAARQEKLDIYGVAGKVVMYNIKTDPKVIVEGVTAFFELIFYLVADGFRIETPLFSLRLRFPGMYSGSENSLPDGVYPRARLRQSKRFRKYLKEYAKVEFDGIIQTGGRISEARDEAMGLSGETATIGNILTIRGYGLKIAADERHKDDVGLFFIPASGEPVKAVAIAESKPRTLTAVVPPSLKAGEPYQLRVVTQGSARSKSQLLKELRQVTSDFTVIARL